MAKKKTQYADYTQQLMNQYGISSDDVSSYKSSDDGVSDYVKQLEQQLTQTTQKRKQERYTNWAVSKITEKINPLIDRYNAYIDDANRTDFDGMMLPEFREYVQSDKERIAGLRSDAMQMYNIYAHGAGSTREYAKDFTDTIQQVLDGLDSMSSRFDGISLETLQQRKPPEYYQSEIDRLTRERQEHIDVYSDVLFRPIIEGTPEDDDAFDQLAEYDRQIDEMKRLWDLSKDEEVTRRNMEIVHSLGDDAEELLLEYLDGIAYKQPWRIQNAKQKLEAMGLSQEEITKLSETVSRQIDMSSTLAENYRNAQGAENIRVAEEALFRDIAAKLPNTFADKWNSWRYLSMLGNVRTHVRNILGNIGFVPVRATKDLIASGIEAGVNSISKDGISRTKGVLLATNKADRALYKAGLSDFAAAEELIGSPNIKSRDSISKIERMRPAFGGDKAIWRALSKVAEANGNALSMEDTLFKKVTYASAFGGYLKSNGITAQMLQNGEVTDSFMDEARAYAFNEALKATYNDFNDFSNFVANIGNLRHSDNTVAKAAGFLVEGVLPFKRTPANIVARSVEYSPIGMVNGIKQSLVDVRSGKVTAAEAIDNVASGLTGTLLLGLGALLANMGVVSGGDDEDDKQKKFDQLRGKQSYAINAFGGSYTIDWLAPEVIPMFVGVELYNRVNSDGSLQFKDLLDSISRVSNPLLEMSCMSSLNDLLDSISYSDNKLYSVFSQAAANHILQALPTVFGQLERMGETEREQTYIDNNSQLPKDLQYTIAKAANKIPGVEFEQIPYIDAYGRRQESGSLGARIFSNGFSPGYLGSDKSTPWDDELQRLYDLGYSSVLPSAAPKKIGDRDLTADEYVRYATFTGQEKYRLLGEVTSSEYFQQSSDADREEIIKGVYSYVNAAGSRLIDADRDIAAWTEKAMNMEKLGIPFADFLRMKNTALNENGNVTKDVYVSYIRQNFPADKQAEVWAIMKNSSWKDSGTPWG